MFPFAQKSILTIAASFILLGVPYAHAEVADAIPQLGDLERWTVFSLGGGQRPSQAFGHLSIEGDVALAGNGNFLIGGGATFDDDVYGRSNGMVFTIDHAVISGSIFYDQDALLDNGVNDALAASDYALSLTPNRANTSVKLRGDQNITIIGAPGETVVLSLKNFILKGDSSFTLQGTATTTFIINVSKKFSLKGNSHIDLAGLQWNQVLFNVVGAGRKVSLGGNSVFNGILMANNRTIELKGDATVSGEIIANRLKLRGSASVLHPPGVSQ
jgi:Putative Ice-binding-like adhesive domain